MTDQRSQTSDVVQEHQVHASAGDTVNTMTQRSTVVVTLLSTGPASTVLHQYVTTSTGRAHDTALHGHDGNIVTRH